MMKLISLLSIATAVSRATCSGTQSPLLSGAPALAQPSIGFGTWGLVNSEDNTTEAVSLAIQIGYRQIDCASAYYNEKAVGKGIKDGLKKANITRDQLWVTSKLWNDDHKDPAIVEAAFKKTIKDLDLDYIDLYLMHWPVGPKRQLDYVETWRSMIALPKDKVLNIGVSNFSPGQLREIITETGVKPYAHQMELHPYLQQTAWITTHKTLGIAVTAYTPLANTNPILDAGSEIPPLLKNDLFVKIAEKRNCTTAQVALQWGINRGTSVIPKSSHEEYIRQNFAALECELLAIDLAEIKLKEKDYVKRLSNPSKSWHVKLFEGLQDA